jgi:RNA-directed DNA polymerase
VNAQSHPSPYAGDWRYGSARRGRHPQGSTRVATLLTRQHGQCARGGLHYRAGDVLGIDHIIPTE